MSVVKKGIRGIGKGLWVNYFGGIFGRHFTRISKRDQILGKFNAAIADKVVVFADECFYAGDKASLGALKTLITEPTLQIERKGIDPIEVPNFCHLFEATNEDWHTPAGFEERRFLALECSDVWKRRHPEKFDALVEEQHSGGREALLAYLLTRELTEERLRALRQPPRTAELDKQVGLTMSPEERWWFGRLQEGRVTSLADDAWPARVTTEDLHQDYLNYCNDLRLHTRRIDRDHFKKLVLDDVLTKRDRGTKGLRRWTWKLAPLADARRFFDQKKGIETAWDEVPEEPIISNRRDQPSLSEGPPPGWDEVPHGDE